jgi:hypothetical protein
VLSGQSVPLILAAAQPIDGIFRAVNSFPHLAGPTIEGSPEGRTDAELGEAARPILDRLYADELRALHALFDERAAAGRGAVEINDLARAATFGAVETLFVDIDSNLSGTIDEQTGAVTLDPEDQPGDYGIADELARRTLLADGRVLAVRAADVPTEAPAAAILRYAV